MFTLLGLRLLVVVEIFWKKVIKKTELKMIYDSILHRQDMPLVDQGFAYTAWNTSAENSMEIFTWLASGKPSVPVLAFQYIILLLNKTQGCDITYLKRHKWLLIFWHPHHLFGFFCSVDQKCAIKCNGSNDVLPSLLLPTSSWGSLWLLYLREKRW